jgi:hypothetical protein
MKTSSTIKRSYFKPYKKEKEKEKKRVITVKEKICWVPYLRPV